MISAGDNTAQPAPVEATPRIPSLAGRQLVIRADGGPVIGTGHQMRCLAIAEAWVAAGGGARLACTAVPDAVADRYMAAGVEVARRGEWPPSNILDGADAVVADQPGIADGKLAALAQDRAVLVVVDDMGDRACYPGDILLNQNVHATPALYRAKSKALLCLGAPWCLLRQGFADRRREARPVPVAVERIAILLGGADPRRFSEPILQAVAGAAAALSPMPEVVLVVGPANPMIAELRHAAARLPGRVRVEHDVRDMPALLASTDLAVSAAGSTVWEMATLGVPMIVGAQNASEVGPGSALQAAGAGLYLGSLESVRPEVIAAAVTELAGDARRRRSMHGAGRRLVDGRGVDRILALVADLMARRQPPRR